VEQSSSISDISFVNLKSEKTICNQFGYCASILQSELNKNQPSSQLKCSTNSRDPQIELPITEKVLNLEALDGKIIRFICLFLYLTL
jgi:hypothetical protein